MCGRERFIPDALVFWMCPCVCAHHSEVGLSAAILRANYSMASLIDVYEPVDWVRPYTERHSTGRGPYWHFVRAWDGHFARPLGLPVVSPVVRVVGLD